MSEPSTVLGYAPMDHIHAEFETRVARATYCSDEDLPQRLDEVVQHLREHFAQEDRWMQETNFPPATATAMSMLRSSDLPMRSWR